MQAVHVTPAFLNGLFIEPGPHRCHRRAERLCAAPGPAARARGRGGAVLRRQRRGADRRRRGRHGAGAEGPADAGDGARGVRRGLSVHLRPEGAVALAPARRVAGLGAGHVAVARGGGRAGGRLHAAEPACLPGHRAARGQRGRAVRGHAQAVVRGGRHHGQRAVVHLAGLRRAAARTGVRAAARLRRCSTGSSAAPCCCWPRCWRTAPSPGSARSEGRRRRR